MRGIQVAFAVLALVVGLPQPVAEPVPAPDPVVVAVLDSGIFAAHETFAPDQVVAWYDFTLGSEDAVTSWDPRIDPYDDRGHGTAVAAMVGGTSPHQTPSFAPGVKLAIGRVLGPNGASGDAMARAIDWAIHVAGADVISSSIWWSTVAEVGYGLGPSAGIAWDAYPYQQALHDAREADILPVVLAGNQLRHVGCVGPQCVGHNALLNTPGASSAALVVGGAYSDGRPFAPGSATEPEVTSRYWVDTASHTCTDCYKLASGTSYSTPLVAGQAAALIQTVRAHGLPDPTPDRLEGLLKCAARDLEGFTPTEEGYGHLDASALTLARDHLIAGTTPHAGFGTKTVSGLYVEGVQNMARAVHDELWLGRSVAPSLPPCVSG